MESSLHNVADLPAATRAAVEALVGRSLRDDQKLYILAVDHVATPPGVAAQAGDELPDWCNVLEGLSDEEREDFRSALRLPVRLARPE